MLLLGNQTSVKDFRSNVFFYSISNYSMSENPDKNKCIKLKTQSFFLETTYIYANICTGLL
jgi:hypothetical protein